ncbi:DNA adenine methylase [Candidatus Bathyarchaeota archaeon]|nr:DNA adenine methylase [Candidatus Bathyarchaeota archaeon]
MGSGLVKYMGAKRSMLDNGLGELISHRARYATRILDVFSGSAAISWYAAKHTSLQIISTDLQAYAPILAAAVICRTRPLDPMQASDSWLSGVKRSIPASYFYQSSIALASSSSTDPTGHVQAARHLCSQPSAVGPVWNAYGGYYFSPLQALTLDLMLAQLPTRDPLRTVCLAATITAASRCSASPGHTAQPFGSSTASSPHLLAAWARDPISYAEQALATICPLHAKKHGRAFQADALNVVKQARRGDLVIIDPPYSNVQYSRFYHVLQTIAVGSCGEVAGSGRYPPMSERPQSKLSLKGDARVTFVAILDALSDAQATAIVTFPRGRASNGLSGADVVSIARKRFASVEASTVMGSFSTLGGNNGHRNARAPAREMIVLLRPR